jgi:flavin-dependent dehydrogenase
MDQAIDAIITGAGPAGSSAAILLARAGWRVALVEKHAFPRMKVCGGCIAASNLPILNALGVGPSFSAIAGPSILEVGLACKDRIVRAPMPRFADPRHPWGVALSRDHLDTMLAGQARAAGATLYQPWSARHVEGEPGDFRCRIRAFGSQEEKILSAPVLIDAHGSWERSFDDAGHATRQHRASDLFAFMARFSRAQLGAGLLPVLSFPGGYGGMVIAEHGVVTLAFCLRRDVLARARTLHRSASAARAAFEWLLRHCQPVAALLGAAQQDGDWLATGPIRPGIRISPRAPQAFPIGNAAGEAHPIVGEGISMALQSATIVADVLIPHQSRLHQPRVQEQMHREYVQRWRRHFVRRIQLASVFAHTAMRPALVGGLLPFLERNPALLTQFAHWCDKTRPAPMTNRLGDVKPDAAHSLFCPQDR